MFDRDTTQSAANDAHPDLPWAAWPIYFVLAWGDVAVAGLDSWMAVQQSWAAAARGVMRSGPSAQTAEADPLIAATMEDWRACGDALVQAQLEAIAHWRRAS